MLTDSLHPENVASIRGVSPFYNIKAKEIANTSTYNLWNYEVIMILPTKLWLFNWRIEAESLYM